MRWRFDDLITFLSVVESGSVTSAAARLNVAKSVISKRIGDLETALGVQLFRRSTRNVKPTEAGLSFYEQVAPLIRALHETTERVSERAETLSGRLRLTAPVSFGTMFLGPAIAQFAKRHPELDLAVDYDDRPVDLTEGGYDLGVRMGDLKDSSFKARKLCDCARIVCCSPDYAQRHGLPESVADLARHTSVDYAYVRTSSLWQFDTEVGGAKAISVMMRSRIVANNFEAMRDMAVAGLGLVLLPEFLAAGPLGTGALISALPHATPRPYMISAVYPHTNHVSTKVRALIDYLVGAFSPSLPWYRDGRVTTNPNKEQELPPERTLIAA
jgi:DNA-binding transcriptional LysR family regulator